MNHFYKSYKSKKGKVAGTKKKELYEEFKFDYTELPVEDKDEKEDPRRKQKSKTPTGLSVIKSILIVVSDVVGGGIITLPYAMKQTGWYGVPLIFFTSCIMACCGILLSVSCCETLRRSTEIKERSTLRDPYPKLVEFAFGQKIRFLFSILLHVSLIFSCVVAVLLISTNVASLIPIPSVAVSKTDNIRVWIFVTSVTVLLPLSLMGTPKDYWAVALITFMESVLAATFILINVIKIAYYEIDDVKWSSPSLESVAQAYGTILFSFSGISIFPTLQNDLKKPESFYKAVIIGYSIITITYVIIPVASYVLLGERVLPNLFETFQKSNLYRTSVTFKLLSISAQSLICAHLVGTYVFNVNPINLHLEDYIGIPIEFCWQRAVCRSFTVTIITSVALSFPHVASVLPLTGGVFMTLLCVVVPVACYLKLNDGIANVPFGALIFVTVFIVAGAILNVVFEFKRMFS